VYALIERKQDTAVIVAGAHGTQPVEANSDGDIVKLGGLVAFAPPVSAAGGITGQRGVFPLIIGFSQSHGSGVLAVSKNWHIAAAS
jgi:hypothetical protein